LVRWDNLGLPRNAVVISAAISVRIQQWDQLGRCPISARFLTKMWSFNLTDAIGCRNIGWADADK
jgi:hypothetical protein